jgi:hypothetical protein
LKKEETVWDPVRSLAETIPSSTQLGLVNDSRENGYPRRLTELAVALTDKGFHLLNPSRVLELDNNKDGSTHGKYVICYLQR